MTFVLTSPITTAACIGRVFRRDNWRQVPFEHWTRIRTNNAIRIWAQRTGFGYLNTADIAPWACRYVQVIATLQTKHRDSSIECDASSQLSTIHFK